ncbi:MAG: FKBP-type peptidyl-prolyl cis-trans isomerase [Bacteroidales bacterium]|jgi:FKBP-type peptidyl-prolyl cis-trans isomerase|nr:FKBP-type peptidyl-prolyl cis-trans isomerase [Bacteroidales bacterium]
MMKFLNKIVCLAVVAVSLFSCAEEKEESERSIHERILGAYVKEEYPNAQVLPSGLVVIETQEGTGKTLNNREAGYFEYTTRSLSNEVVETTDEQLAREIGTFAHTNYYGPKMFETGYKSTYKGLEEIMVGMKIGGKAKFILPPWLSVTGNNGNRWEESNSLIYEIELKEVISVIDTWEADTMRRYAATHYPGLDTLSSHFYLKKLNNIQHKDTLESATLNVRYIGRLLDGWVFDTNIADTAKKYGIYDPDNDYNALEFKWNDDIETMEKDNSMVRGFCMALKEMNYGDIAFTMFGSKYGYDYRGKSPIGPYQPLIFWLEVEPKQ